MVICESTLTKQAKTRRLMINFNTCEVRCPFHKKDVDVLTVCMESPSGGGCEYYSRMDTTSGLHCKWTADSDE